MTTDNFTNQKNSKLKAFFVEQLQDILWAEKKIMRTLPKLHAAATSGELRNALFTHLEETRNHVDRLYSVFLLIGEDVHTKKCLAMSGIVEEAEEIVEETEEASAQRDVGIIFAAQKADHYEIATYGGLVTLAETLGYFDACEILKQTLAEEKQSDALLSAIAKSRIDYKASLEPQTV